jgi:hypothetical protein
MNDRMNDRMKSGVFEVDCCIHRRSSMKLLFALSLAAALTAQETPTEREAAHDLLAKMATLEKSLDVPGWVARLTAANPERDRVTARTRELWTQELQPMGDDITRNPEIGFVEKRSIGKLTDYLRAHGFDVKVGGGDSIQLSSRASRATTGHRTWA